MMWRTVVAGILVCVGAAIPVEAPAQAAPGTDIDRFGGGSLTATGDLVFSSVGWGRTASDELFRDSSIVALDDNRSVLAIRDGRLVRVDIATGGISVGDPVPSDGRVFSVHPTGAWVYLVTGQFPYSGLLRYSVDDLGFDRDYSGQFPELDFVGVAGVPGDSLREVIHTSNRVVLMIDGNVADEEVAVERANGVRRIIAVDDSLAYAETVNGLAELRMSSSGIESLTMKATFAVSDRFRIVGDLAISGEVATSLLDFSTRRATQFERALPDPELPYRYFIDASGFTTAVKVFDDDGNVVIDRPGGCSSRAFEFVDQPNTDGFVGNGLFVEVLSYGLNSSIPVAVTDLLTACGAYGEFTAVQPDRVYDTRRGNSEPGAGRPLRAGSTTRVKIHDDGGVPATGVESVVLNVTAVRQRDVGRGSNYITVWPAGFERPSTASLNLADDETVGNMVTISTAADGFVDVYSNAGTVDLTVDVMGYFSSSLGPAGSRFSSVAPSRVLDTRVSDARVGAGGRVGVDVFAELERRDAVFGIGRSEVVAAVVNVSAVRPTEKGFFRIFPSGSALPDASSMNFAAGTNTARLVTVPLSAGSFELRNEIGSSHVVIDIVGFYVRQPPEDQSGRFVGVVPFRELDTRNQAVFGDDGRIPEASAVTLGGFVPGVDLVTNLTAIRPTRLGFLSTGPWRGEQSFRTLDDTSSLNFGPETIIANQAIIRPSEETAEIAIYNGIGRTHVTLDVSGFYTAPDSEFLFE